MICLEAVESPSRLLPNLLAQIVIQKFVFQRTLARFIFEEAGVLAIFHFDFKYSSNDIRRAAWVLIRMRNAVNARDECILIDQTIKSTFV